MVGRKECQKIKYFLTFQRKTDPVLQDLSRSVPKDNRALKVCEKWSRKGCSTALWENLEKCDFLGVILECLFEV